MPGLEDAMFSKSVVFVCEHTERGALGLVINKPADIGMEALFGKVDLPLKRLDLVGSPVFQGGPVQTERGFVLHEAVRAEGQDPDRGAGTRGQGQGNRTQHHSPGSHQNGAQALG